MTESRLAHARRREDVWISLTWAMVGANTVYLVLSWFDMVSHFGKEWPILALIWCGLRAARWRGWVAGHKAAKEDS